MDFNNIYKSYEQMKKDEAIDDAAYKDYVADCKQAGLSNFGWINFNTAFEEMFSERKVLDNKADDALGQIFAYCIAKKYNLNLSQIIVSTCESLDGYVYNISSEYDNFAINAGIDGQLRLIVSDVNKDITILKEIKLEDLLSYGFDKRLINILSDSIGSMSLGDTAYYKAYGYDNFWDMALDKAERYLERDYDLSQNETFNHWLDEGLIDHLPTKEDCQIS